MIKFFFPQSKFDRHHSNWNVWRDHWNRMMVSIHFIKRNSIDESNNDDINWIFLCFTFIDLNPVFFPIPVPKAFCNVRSFNDITLKIQWNSEVEWLHFFGLVNWFFVESFACLKNGYDHVNVLKCNGMQLHLLTMVTLYIYVCVCVFVA